MQVSKQVVKGKFSILKNPLDCSAGKRTFSSQNTLLGSINPERNHSLRVMSTPTWPVPYYQRLMRHPVNSGDIDKGNLSYIAVECDDLHAMIAKEQLKA